jgi:hypothetical protein
LTDEEFVDLYRWMRVEQRYAERMVSLQRRGQMGTVASGRGHEASIVGSGYPLAEDDWLLGMGREVTAMLIQGVSIRDMVLYWRGIEDAAKYLAEENCMIGISIGGHIGGLLAGALGGLAEPLLAPVHPLLAADRAAGVRVHLAELIRGAARSFGMGSAELLRGHLLLPPGRFVETLLGAGRGLDGVDHAVAVGVARQLLRARRQRRKRQAHPAQEGKRTQTRRGFHELPPSFPVEHAATTTAVPGGSGLFCTPRQSGWKRARCASGRHERRRLARAASVYR